MVEGKREISFSPPGGESSDRGGDFSKEEFSPTTEKGGSEGEGSSLGKELPEPSGGRVTSLRGSVAKSEGGGGGGSEES